MTVKSAHSHTGKQYHLILDELCLQRCLLLLHVTVRVPTSRSQLRALARVPKLCELFALPSVCVDRCVYLWVPLFIFPLEKVPSVSGARCPAEHVLPTLS